MSSAEVKVVRFLFFIFIFNLMYFLILYPSFKNVINTLNTEVLIFNIVVSSLGIHSLFALISYFLARTFQPFRYRVFFGLLSGLFPLLNIVHGFSIVGINPVINSVLNIQGAALIYLQLYIFTKYKKQMFYLVQTYVKTLIDPLDAIWY